ncbi:hypothetical protein DAPPUDRAFT_113355 [Daphnia pulex]|uniref:Uncharacterized protein n=1 Tax=Daphnia pulex TaxID=6669 RepID=E9HET3_DAPPU|nr:hypothetical protein DAPPUDRAFT_113355 [Daphnia pulex]|eukprot:EFX69726.1 hypothetical protein DAPPUDRAFT_113355 [Daphnia pulex]
MYAIIYCIVIKNQENEPSRAEARPHPPTRLHSRLLWLPAQLEMQLLLLASGAPGELVWAPEELQLLLLSPGAPGELELEAVLLEFKLELGVMKGVSWLILDVPLIPRAESFCQLLSVEESAVYRQDSLEMRGISDWLQLVIRDRLPWWGTRWWFHPCGHEPFLEQLRPLVPFASFSYFEIELGVLSAPLLVVERPRENISANSNDKGARERQGVVAYKKGEAIVVFCFFCLASG